jgi:3-hydroxyisobutyrate dehydrogenase
MQIAVLGAGSMGSALVETLLAAGHSVVVYNRTPAKTTPLVALGAVFAETPALAIRSADVTLLVLADSTALRETLLNSDTRDSISGRKFLNVTTTSREDIVEISQEVAIAGGVLAEVSITVLPAHIRAKRGQFVLGCSTEDEPFWTNLLLSVGEWVRRAGEVGDASRAEAPFVAIFMFNFLATAYAAALAAKLNVDPEILLHTLTTNPTMLITGADVLLPQMFERKYAESAASIDNMSYAATMTFESARSLGLPTKILEGMAELCAAASAQGLGAKDVAAVFEALVEPVRVS